MDLPAQVAFVGTCDGPFGVTASRGQIAEAGKRVGVLYIDQARLDVTGLRRLVARPDAAGHLLRAAHARVAVGPVTHPRVGLGLQRVQVGDQCRRQVLPRATQGGLGVLDDLTVQAEIQGLVGQERHHPVPSS